MPIFIACSPKRCDEPPHDLLAAWQKGRHRMRAELTVERAQDPGVERQTWMEVERPAPRIELDVVVVGVAAMYAASVEADVLHLRDRKSTRLNSSHVSES